MNIQNTVGHGVGGTDVTNFTFNYGKVNNSQTDASSATEEANIGFYVNETNSTRNNLDGIVNIIGNQLTNAQFHGIDIFNFSGTITDLNIKSNTITSSTSVAASQGGGIRIVAFGSATTIANVTKASIDKNTVSNFPSGFGIEVQGGNGNLAGPSTGFVGHVGSATDVISITDNTVSGASAANRLGTFGITATVNGRGQGNFFIGDGDDVNTTGNSISNSTGNAINIGSFGFANVEAKIDANVVVAHTASGAAGIGAGTSIVLNSDETPTLTVTVTNNNVSQTDGNGILVTARDGKGTLNASIKNNTVAAPLGGARPGIRVDSGNGVNTNGGTENETTCLRISGNTTAGTGHTIAGIGLRKQGTSSSLNIFGIVGALAMGRIAARRGAYSVVMGALVIWILLVIVGFVVPKGSVALFLLLAIGIGLIVAGTQALSRSMYSQLIPRGREGEYFSLYQACERGTSWLGTLLFGVVHQISGSYRWAIVALIVFFAVGIVLLRRVDMRTGVVEAGNEVPAVL